MDKDIYFVSDNHFKPIPNHGEEERRQLFFDFLDQIKPRAGKLFLVGDVFDFWFEYKYVIPKYLFDVLHKLQELARADCEINILGGNHDYWLGSFFSDNLIKPYQEDIEIELDNKLFLITHGDGKLNIDPFYPYLKKIIRNEFVIKVFRLLHPDIAFKIADLVSRSSRSQDPDTSPELEQFYKQKIEQFCKRAFKNNFDFIVTGHYHYPTRYDLEGSTFINLGDWVRHFTYGRFSKGKLYLENFSEQSKVY